MKKIFIIPFLVAIIFCSHVHAGLLANIKNWVVQKIVPQSNEIQINLRWDDELLKPKYLFDDVIGLASQKERLMDLFDCILQAKHFKNVDTRKRRCLTLYGPPGNGKSFLVEAFFGELYRQKNVKCLFFDSKFINKRGCDFIFDIAKNDSPCIIFIDSVWKLFPEIRTLIGHLDEFLCSDEGRRVAFIITIERQYVLEDILQNYSNIFGSPVFFSLPTFKERKELFVKKLTPLVSDLSIFDLDTFAEKAEGLTYHDLSCIVDNAFQKTKRLGALAQGCTYKLLEALHEVNAIYVQHDRDRIQAQREAEMRQAEYKKGIAALTQKIQTQEDIDKLQALHEKIEMRS